MLCPLATPNCGYMKQQNRYGGGWCQAWTAAASSSRLSAATAEEVTTVYCCIHGPPQFTEAGSHHSLLWQETTTVYCDRRPPQFTIAGDHHCLLWQEDTTVNELCGATTIWHVINKYAWSCSRCIVNGSASSSGGWQYWLLYWTTFAHNKLQKLNTCWVQTYIFSTSWRHTTTHFIFICCTFWS